MLKIGLRKSRTKPCAMACDAWKRPKAKIRLAPICLVSALVARVVVVTAVAWVAIFTVFVQFGIVAAACVTIITAAAAAAAIVMAGVMVDAA